MPRYISEGLRWLAHGNLAALEPPPAVAVAIVAEVVGVALNVAEEGENG
ncbi:hypothetical protein [Undibacterium sp. GrIS 1.2]